MSDRVDNFDVSSTEPDKIDGDQGVPDTNAHSRIQAQTCGEHTHGRGDRGRLHGARNSVLSRGLLEALKRRGENIRTLRKLEVDLRAALKPSGALGCLLFDRFWASVLRMILVARVEEVDLGSRPIASNSSVSHTSFLRDDTFPVLVDSVEAGHSAHHQNTEPFESDLFRRLGLMARYDRSASREFYRTMSLLLLMRSEGAAGLESWAQATIGNKTER